MALLRLMCLGVAGVLVGLMFAPGAGAAVTSKSMAATSQPTGQRQTAFGAASLNVSFGLGYGSMFTPPMTKFVLHFDDDFAFDPSGFPECNLSAIATVPEATAKASCPNSQVGSGDLEVNGGVLIGVIAAFNGQPQSGQPTIGLHTDVFTAADAYAFTTTLTGVLDRAASRLTVFIPPTGTALTHLNVTFPNQPSTVGNTYVSARCNDTDQIWNYSVDFTFVDASTGSASASQGCQVLAEPASGPTGQRDAALKKCEKKKHHNKKKFKKCKKKANRLPI